MKRRILIALLSLGTIGGFAAGAASLSCRTQHRRAHFERHVASLCVDAARKTDADRGANGSAEVDAHERDARER